MPTTRPWFSIALTLVLLSTSGVAEADPQSEFKLAYQAYQEQITAGDKHAALPHAKRAWNLGKQLFGSDDANTEMLAYNYAANLLDTGHTRDAIELLDVVESAFARRHGKTSVEWIAVMIDLGSALASTNRSGGDGGDARAASVFEEVLTAAKRLYGKQSLDVALLRMQAGDALANRARSVRASDYLRDARKALTEHPEATARQRAQAHFLYGKFLVESQRYEQSISVLNDAVQGFQGDSANQDKLMAAHAGLVSAYEETGQRDAATDHCLAIAATIPASGNRKAHPLYQRPPQWPGSGSRRGAEVVLELQISAAGFVTHADVLSNSGHDDFAEAALAVIRSWRFAPTFEQGKPVASTGLQSISFVRDPKPNVDRIF